MRTIAMIPDEAITEFIEIYFRLYGVRLDWDIAVDKANRLFRMTKAILS
jgi:hypothetical protein